MVENMNLQRVLALFDKENRIDIEYPRMDKQVLPHVIRFVGDELGMNYILYSSLMGANLTEVIQEQIDYFTKLNQPFEWKVYGHDYPPDLKDRLVETGFILDEREAVMILDLEDVPSSLLSPVDKDIRPIVKIDQLEDVVAVERQVWGDEFGWIKTELGADIQIPGYLSAYVAYINDQPACTGWIYFHPQSQFASLWGGATVEEYRRSGLFTAILATRVQEAIQRGYKYIVIDAGPMSQPIVSKHGFHLLTYTYACKWKGHQKSDRE
jgi:hypothetical protein